jgi:hypothetical protein
MWDIARYFTVIFPSIIFRKTLLSLHCIQCEALEPIVPYGNQRISDEMPVDTSLRVLDKKIARKNAYHLVKFSDRS